MAKMRTDVLKIRISVMPAQVLRKMVVGCELIAKAVTSEMESQHVELMPRKRFSVRRANGKFYF